MDKRARVQRWLNITGELHGKLLDPRDYLATHPPQRSAGLAIAVKAYLISFGGTFSFTVPVPGATASITSGSAESIIVALDLSLVS